MDIQYLFKWLTCAKLWNVNPVILFFAWIKVLGEAQPEKTSDMPSGLGNTWIIPQLSLLPDLSSCTHTELPILDHENSDLKLFQSATYFYNALDLPMWFICLAPNQHKT